MSSQNSSPRELQDFEPEELSALASDSESFTLVDVALVKDEVFIAYFDSNVLAPGPRMEPVGKSSYPYEQIIRRLASELGEEGVSLRFVYAENRVVIHVYPDRQPVLVGSYTLFDAETASRAKTNPPIPLEAFRFPTPPAPRRG